MLRPPTTVIGQVRVNAIRLPDRARGKTPPPRPVLYMGSGKAICTNSNQILTLLGRPQSRFNARPAACPPSDALAREGREESALSAFRVGLRCDFAFPLLGVWLTIPMRLRPAPRSTWSGRKSSGGRPRQ